MRGDTSDRLVDAGPGAGTVIDLLARAADAVTIVDVQRLVAELRGHPDVRDAAIELHQRRR